MSTTLYQNPPLICFSNQDTCLGPKVSTVPSTHGKGLVAMVIHSFVFKQLKLVLQSIL